MMTQTSLPFHERRTAPREIVHTPAVIVFDSARQRLPCVIRNISSEGAKLEVFARSQIPMTFELLVGEKLVRCRMVWRALKDVGVAFDRD